MSEGVSPIEEFLKKAGGPWLRADNVQVGDRLQILTEPVVDDQTFDRAYLVCDALLIRTGEQFKVRLSKTNVTRIAQTLGTKSWKGKYIEVMSIENYPGLRQKGILFKGVAPTEQAALPQTQPSLTPTPSPVVSDEITSSVKELISFYDEIPIERLEKYLKDKGFEGSVDDVIKACGLIKDDRGYVRKGTA
jgi:hypothetical protein